MTLMGGKAEFGFGAGPSRGPRHCATRTFQSVQCLLDKQEKMEKMELMNLHNNCNFVNIAAKQVLGSAFAQMGDPSRYKGDLWANG